MSRDSELTVAPVVRPVDRDFLLHRPQLFTALSVQSPDQESTQWLTWPKLDDHTSHEVVLDAALIVEWHDRQVSRCCSVKKLC